MTEVNEIERDDARAIGQTTAPSAADLLWQPSAVDATKVDIDVGQARRDIDARNAKLTAAQRDSLSVEDAREAVKADVASIGAIEDQHARSLAVLAISHNADSHAAYRSQLQAQAPSLAREAQEAATVALDAAAERKAYRDVVLRSDEMAELPRDALTGFAAREAVRADVADMAAIQDPDLRFSAALAMNRSGESQTAYRAELQAQAPEVDTESKSAAKEIADLDAKMAKAELGERGWRDRHDIDDLMTDLERLASRDWQAAANLWDKYRPGEVDKPIFIDGDDVDAPKGQRGPAGQTQARGDEPGATADDTKGAKARKDDDEERFATPEALRRRFLEAEGKFYFRDDENRLAFEDKGQRLATEHNDPEVAKSMVELAAAKGWTSIRVKGSEEFKRETWLQASLRGLQVEGFQPRDVDRAKLADLQEEFGTTAPKRVGNEILQGRERAQAHGPAIGGGDGRVVDEAEASLSKQQRSALTAMRAILKDRGDSDEAVAMASAIAIERFQTNRVYVGKVVEHGEAPYENDPKNERSYFVKLHTDAGDRVVWGVDLARAASEGHLPVGEDVALAYQGKKPVQVETKVRDDAGNVVGTKTVDTHRNEWDVRRLEAVREEAQERLKSASQARERQPLVKVYDRDAERATARAEPSAPVADKQKTRARG